LHQRSSDAVWAGDLEARVTFPAVASPLWIFKIILYQKQFEHIFPDSLSSSIIKVLCLVRTADTDAIHRTSVAEHLFELLQIKATFEIKVL